MTATYPTLKRFINALEARGELIRVAEPISPILEIAEVAHRHARQSAPSTSRAASVFDPARAGSGGMGLLFEQVEGCDFPLAINLFGSYRRMEMAIGCDSSEGFTALANRIGSLAKPQPPRSLGEAMSKARELMPLLKVGPRRRRGRGRCQQVIGLTERGEVDLTRLPLLKCWPLDGDPAAVGFSMDAQAAGTAAGEGRYITFAGMHTIHVDDRDDPRPASHNIGMYRAQLIDATHLAMHWHVHHDGASHWRSWKAAGLPMPIAICLGGESVLPYAATAPLPPGLSELLMAGFLNGRGISMVRAQTVPLWVPANSEIVIEGYVSTECGPIGFDPQRDELGPGAVFEGPFGDHTGYYSMPDRYPIVDVTAVTHARRAIFPATIVGLPPQEDYYVGKATERVFLPLLQTLIHDILDYHLPLFGCFHNCVFVKIHKAYPLQGRRVMHSIWGAGQMAWTKLIVVVDEDVDVHDEQAVWRAVFQQCRFDRDLEIVNGPLDILDHAAPRLGAGHKLGIDATTKVVGEEVNGVAITPPIPPGRCEDAELFLGQHLGQAGMVDVHVPLAGGGRCVFIGVEKTEPGDGLRALQAMASSIHQSNQPHRDVTGDFLVAVDRSVDLSDMDAVLFHTAANFDPGRDLFRSGHRVGLDGTIKQEGDQRNGQPVRPFPPLIAMDADVRERIEERKETLGLE